MAATFNLYSNTSILPGIDALIEGHNLNHTTQINSENIPALYNEIIAKGEQHPDVLEMRNLLRLKAPLTQLGVDPQTQENSLNSLLVLYSLQEKDRTNSTSPAFLYAVNFAKATEEIIARTRIQSDINSESVFATDNSIPLNKLRQRIADSLALSLTEERLDRVKNKTASSSDYFDNLKPEIIKERVDRFSAIKEMLLGDKKVTSSTFDKVLELEKLLSKSFVANPDLKPTETIPLLKEIVKSLSRSSLNASLNEEGRVIGHEILLKEIISMIQNKEIKSLEDLQSLASISEVVRDKLLANLRLREHFSNPNTFKNWLLSLVANPELRKITSGEERAHSIMASAEKLVREEEQRLVINNRAPRGEAPQDHVP